MCSTSSVPISALKSYATEKYGIQSFEELKNHAWEITQQRELAHQFEQQLQQHYEPAEPQIPPDFQKPISHHEQPPTEVKTGKTVADRYREATERYHEREHRPTREYNFEQGKNLSLEE